MILKDLKQKVKLLKRESVVIYFALKDRRTPFLAKIFAAITVGYLLSPVDLIPDFIPVLGLLDDLVLVPLLITFTLKLIPEDLIKEIRVKVSSDEKLAKQWYFALPVVAFYIVLIIWLFKKFYN